MGYRVRFALLVDTSRLCNDAIAAGTVIRTSQLQDLDSQLAGEAVGEFMGVIDSVIVTDPCVIAADDENEYSRNSGG